MDCEKIREKLSRRIDETLSEPEERGVKEHLSSCDSCSTYLEELKKGQSLLNTLEPVEPPLWLTQKIMARVREETERQEHSLLSWFFQPLKLKIPLQALALCLVVGLAILLYRANAPEYQRLEQPEIKESQETERSPRPVNVGRPNKPEQTVQAKAKSTTRQEQQVSPAAEAPAKAVYDSRATGASSQHPEAKASSPTKEEALQSLQTTDSAEKAEHQTPPATKAREAAPRAALPEKRDRLESEDRQLLRSPATVVQKGSVASAAIHVAIKTGQIEAATKEIEDLLREAGAAETIKRSIPDGHTITTHVGSQSLTRVLRELRNRFEPVIEGSRGQNEPVLLEIKVTTR